MHYYKIRHHTRYRYTAPVGESVMEVRMQPRSDDQQHCFSFELKVTPQARVISYQDYLQNQIHFFDIPRRHGQLVLRAEALVGLTIPDELPENLRADAWAVLDELSKTPDYWDLLTESHFVRFTPLLAVLADELVLDRRTDPLTLLHHINTGIYYAFRYVPESTSVDSPIDVALESRRGVCQDYAHVMLALVRRMGIPCRYVSGYLFTRRENNDQSADDASHAWVEAYLPDLGWLGFDPTNNLIAGERHIRVAVGRDYADVPPTRGLFKGDADSKMEVGVQVTRTDRPEPEKELLSDREWEAMEGDLMQQQQQQQ
jgi:transglutaminase-like putative cysteine protease